MMRWALNLDALVAKSKRTSLYLSKRRLILVQRWYKLELQTRASQSPVEEIFQELLILLLSFEQSLLQLFDILKLTLLGI